MKEKDNICRIPVKAYFETIDGEPRIVKAEYADIPAEKIAAFLVERFGYGTIFGDKAVKECDN